MAFSPMLKATLVCFAFWMCFVLRAHALTTSNPLALLTRQASDESPIKVGLTQQIEVINQNEQCTPSSQTCLNANSPNHAPGFGMLEDLYDALETLQTRFFEVWLGTWPDAIDWTGAVIGTHLSDGLISLTKSLDYLLPPIDSPSSGKASIRAQAVENEINKYFSQSVAYYFGENAFAIRTQAYDDMLWVVLGWLQSVKFIGLHVSRHYPATSNSAVDQPPPWYGHQFKSSFAHRARVFYELASKGWDNTLCGGGMVWNHNLAPYKNAITNELFISAAIGMYLYFPGDWNESPFLKDVNIESDPVKPHNDRFLNAAIRAYNWLRTVNMTNDQGLYVDGFHIDGWGKNGSIGTGMCDIRNEMVYTYNQGVILSGLRGLWEGTGNISYLEDGHRLMRNVIRATGWSTTETLRSGKWSGLGRDGILEDYCDSKGDCSQDGQAFKGIFFHHLILFCEPLPTLAKVPGKTYSASPTERILHAQNCREFVPWVNHNAHVALKTRDENGVFGMWWGHESTNVPLNHAIDVPLLPTGAEDYRGKDMVPLNDIWQQAQAAKDFEYFAADKSSGGSRGERASSMWNSITLLDVREKDVNDRGRGRTAETQGSGVAVTRALWELAHLFRHDG